MRRQKSRTQPLDEFLNRLALAHLKRMIAHLIEAQNAVTDIGDSASPRVEIITVAVIGDGVDCASPSSCCAALPCRLPARHRNQVISF